MPNAEPPRSADVRPEPRPEPRPEGRAGANLLFLREEEIRQAQTMLLLAARDIAALTDRVLEPAGLGRAHHRALVFISRSPGMTVTDLITALGVTKQSLARVLNTLVEQNLVDMAPGRTDRRQRLLRLTPAGEAMERALFDRQRERIVAAYREAGPAAVDGFRRVLRGLISRAGQAYLDTEKR